LHYREWSALRPDRFIPGGWSSYTHQIGGWGGGGPQSCPKAIQKKK
jgi:hypothetical protein